MRYLKERFINLYVQIHLVLQDMTCGLACKAYTKALVPDNLIAGFTKTGIYPLDKLACPLSSLYLHLHSLLKPLATNEPEKNEEVTTLVEPIATESNAPHPDNENTELSSESPLIF
ncbi:hypothetical protein KUTeg_008592 [Tegillarca granosa]|uniref:Uncharacterized protein n=1 Tax=Tegillarca granosa TaxID=220873 RepID=A0ABQ9F9L5_TEGGR|nr:hypothetical protein KUTeg_008592 [Tegillarca granosa]